MGCFSWLLSDTKKGLRIGQKSYLPFPKDKGAFGLAPGTILLEPSYGGYGIFDQYDIFDLVAIWNREYLAQNPDYIIPHEKKAISALNWYKYYSDLSLDENEIVQAMRNCEDNKYFEFRYIGISISCYDKDNSKLPYPIKICKFQKNARYENLEASNNDPLQGCF